MSEHELEKLLGGFAVNTLTAEERQKLFTAALQDQQLFNALADEQALKELLADPTVRRKLLQALKETSTSGAVGSLSWFDWFRRPAGLAFAGGLAAVVFAVVLGTKIYQDSLKQAAQSVATEEAKPAMPPAPATSASQPASPHVAEPQSNDKDNVLVDKLAKRERSAPPPPREQRTSDAVRDGARQRSEQDDVRRQAEAPVTALGKATRGLVASADQKSPVQRSQPPAAASEPAPMQAPASAPAASAVTPVISARTLFYGEPIMRPDERVMAQEKERTMNPLAESAPQANRPERKLDRVAAAGKATEAVTQFEPLGLRYSFLIRGADGQDREVDAATALRTGGHTRLTVEANQPAYLQIWKTVGSSTTQLLYPDKESGQVSVKLAAGQRQHIPLPPEIGTAALTARLSRVPFGPITRQEAAMLDRPSPNQIQESISPRAASGKQEHATYVVTQDLSPTAQITVEIPFGR